MGGWARPERMRGVLYITETAHEKMRRLRMLAEARGMLCLLVWCRTHENSLALEAMNEDAATP